MSDTPDFSPEAIAEALREATPGPWECWQDNPSLPGMWCVGRPEEVEGQSGDSSAFVAGEVWDEADAHLIANAPTWLAQLLAALSERDAEIDRLARDRANLDTLAKSERTQRGVADAKYAQLLAALEAAQANEQLWRAEWEQITETARVLQERAVAAEAALEAKDGEVARLREALSRIARMRPEDAGVTRMDVAEFAAAALAPSTPKGAP